jgi:hypothetical protein
MPALQGCIDNHRNMNFRSKPHVAFSEAAEVIAGFLIRRILRVANPPPPTFTMLFLQETQRVKRDT